jgi:hypothetical protein
MHCIGIEMVEKSHILTTSPPAGKPVPIQVVRSGLRLALIIAIISVSMILIAMVAALGVYSYYQYHALILPGVQVNGVPVEGLTIEEAAAKIDQIWNVDYRITAVDTTMPKRSWIIPPAEFGLFVDSHTSAFEAFQVGRSRNLTDRLWQIVDVLGTGWYVFPSVIFDEATAREGLGAWKDHFEIPKVEGDVRFEEGVVVAVEPQIGRSLNIEDSLELISSDPAAVMMEYQFIPLVMELEKPSVTNIASAVSTIESWLESGTTLQAYDPVTNERFIWTPSMQEIASWVRVDRRDYSLQPVVEEEPLAEYVAGLDPIIGEARTIDHGKAIEIVKNGLSGAQVETLLIQHQPTSYVVQPTDNMVTISFKFGMPYWKILEVNPSIGTRGLVVGEPITIPPKDAMLTLSVVIDKRIVISLTKQHMWVYQDGDLFREHVISTGMSSSPTLPGIFQVQWHFINAYGSRWDLWMPHFLGIYEASPGFINGIHGLPLLSSGVRLWGNVLGRPASFGCIILDLNAAEELYYWAEDGVVVEIQP